MNEKSSVEEFVGVDGNKGREKEKRSSIKYSKEYGIDQRQKPRAKSQIVQRNDKDDINQREEQDIQE